MCELFIDDEGMYIIPADKSMWCVSEWNASGELEQQSYWRTRDDAIHHAKRMHKFLKKYHHAGSEIHVEEEEICTLEDSEHFLDKGAEL